MVSILTTALLSLLGTAVTAVISVVGVQAVKFIAAKKKAVIQKIGVTAYEQKVTLATEAWKTVEEFSRTHPEFVKTAESTLSKFSTILLGKIPGITATEVADLRDTVAGELNEWKSKAVTVATETTQADNSTVTAAQNTATVDLDALAEQAAAKVLASLTQTLTGKTTATSDTTTGTTTATVTAVV
jgi:hypothetical protein